MSKAKDEGYDAFCAGRSESANPYDVTSDDFLSWNDGYILAQEEADEEDAK